MREPSYIRELCLGVHHRWEPERFFVIFTAYVDESDSHGGADALTMGCLLGSARAWELFERRLRGLQRDLKFDIFHTVEAHNKAKRSPQDMARFKAIVEGIAQAAGDELTQQIGVTLPRQLYLSEYRNKPFPRRMPVESQWGICFRFCLVNAVQIVAAQRGSNRLHIIVEAGHRNSGAAVVIAKSIRDELLAHGNKLLGPVTYEYKNTCAPLMAADMVSGGFKSNADTARSSGRDRMGEASTPQRQRGGFSRIEIEPRHLHGLKDLFVQTQKEKHDAYLARKAAYRNGKDDS